MTIAKDFASKAAVALVAVAMIFSVYAPAAQAQSTEDLQQMINDLLSQIAGLQAQLGQGSGTGVGSSTSNVCPYTWTRNLSQGDTGHDVIKLQQFLNADPDTRVAATGAGSVGMETSYFGPATAAAVSKFQVKYRSEVLSPVGLVNPTPFFGPSSRAKANSLCATAPTPTPVPTPTPTPGDEDEDEEEEDEFELGGEGELSVFEADDADDTEVQEGAEDRAIAELTLEANHGDIEMDRMTFELDGTGNTEDDPWDVFEEISLWVDGEKIADFEADDEDNYLDEDDGEFRFSNLDLILEEDEEVDITVAATVANHVDGAGTAADWTITVTEVRYFDADGVANNDDSTDELSSGASATFEIVEEGDGEELKFSLASGNPSASDIIVDESNKTNDVTILEYNIEAEDNDIEINSLFVNVVTSATTSVVVDDIELVIDGQSFRDEAVASGKTVVNSTTSTTYKFDIDGDIEIDEGDEVTVEVVVDFKSAGTNGANYANGTTIMAQVTSTERDDTDAEGADDIDTFSGSAIGKTHTLVAEGIVVPADDVETSTNTSGQNDTLGEFTIEFDVTAVEGDFYITDNAALASTSPSDGLEFTINGPAGGIVDATVSSVVSSTGDEDTSGVFTVRENETETFTVLVTIDPDESGNYRVQLESVFYSSNTNGTTGAEEYEVIPAQDFRTSYIPIQAS